MFLCQNPLSFAHLLLAYANYNMYVVVTESLHPNTSSPLWLVTLWATAYFTHLVTSSLVFREIDVRFFIVISLLYYYTEQA